MRNAVDYVSIGGNVQECSEVRVTEDDFERGPTLVVSRVRPIDAMIPTNARESWNADCSSQMLNWGVGCAVVEQYRGWLQMLASASI